MSLTRAESAAVQAKKGQHMKADAFVTSIETKVARIGIIGQGYVGLPMGLNCIEQGFKVIGFDTDANKCAKLMGGESYIKHVGPERIVKAVKDKMFFATTNFAHLKSCDAILICVPTPLTDNRDPDMQYVIGTSESIAKYLQPGQLVVMESTSYPGTTSGLIRPILEKSGLKAGQDFFLAASPEREDPGNKKFNTRNIPKVVGGYSDECQRAACALYGAIVDTIVPVTNADTAEAVKIHENGARCVNIAFANEQKIIYGAMGIDIYEVIYAAATKGFGFMPYYPGPGLGGHCIPVDPYYEAWKAREFDLTARFIELAGEINTSMHHYVYDKIVHALNDQSKPLRNSLILVLGLSYKPDIDDMRESPSLPIMDMLLKSGACVRWHDPHIEKLVPTRKYNFGSYDKASFSTESMDLTPENVENFDAAVIVTNHSSVKHEMVLTHCPVVVDCRNALGTVADPKLRAKIVKA